MPDSTPAQTGSSAPIECPSMVATVVVLLLSLFATMLFTSVRQESGLGDETMHLFAGYEYWKHADFGRNPEHPPFAKLLAALPLLPMHLHEPPTLPIPFFKAQDSTSATPFLYTQNGNAMLMRGRMVILIFSLCLGLLIFFAGREMFSPLVGLLALGLLVFEPVILANGALITTDVPLTCLFFATIYAFYRYLQIPTWQRLALCAIASGLTLATKHSGILILPTLLLLALFDLLITRTIATPASTAPPLKTRALNLAGAIALITLVSYVTLWAIYTFRFAAHPDAHPMAPPFAAYAARLTPLQHSLITFAARHHLFPEAYLFGWTDILLIPNRAASFLLGRFHQGPYWPFLPFIFLIKTTVAVLVLLLLVPFTRIFQRRREALFLVLPAVLFALSAFSSGINLGVRHLLPIYPFCFILAAFAAVFFAQRYRFARIGLAALLLLTIVSSLHVFPDYLVYANELFGGPSHIYRLAADANSDWGQGQIWTQRYIDRTHPPECWVSNYSSPIVPEQYYGVHCKPLLNGFSRAIGAPLPPLPRTISGTILIGNTDISGFLWGPGALNPYAAFRDSRPDKVLNNDIRVYQGTYDISLLAALNNTVNAQAMLQRGKPAAALDFAKTAAEQYPNSADVQAILGQTLLANGQPAAGQKALAQALHLAQTIEPDYQQPLIVQLQHPAPHP